MDIQDKKTQKYISKEDALAKLQSYCVYQDRCHKEVRTKLLKLKIYGDDLEEIMADLISENYLNEERYARSYVRGKYRIKQWGRNKILQGLKAKNISDYCIRKGMQEIDEEEYNANLISILTKKIGNLNNIEGHIKYRQCVSFAVRKGYEYELITEVMRRWENL